jgi:hypothetical protein
MQQRSRGEETDISLTAPGRQDEAHSLHRTSLMHRSRVTQLRWQYIIAKV